MKRAQEVQGVKKRVHSSHAKHNSSKQASKENKTNVAKGPKKPSATASVEVYLNVPTYKSPTRLTDSQSATVFAEIGNNLKSPPFLETMEEALEQYIDDEFTVQCIELANAHYIK